MLNFDEEVKKFQPVLNVNSIEKELTSDELSDLMDFYKQYIDKRLNDKKAVKDKEI